MPGQIAAKSKTGAMNEKISSRIIDLAGEEHSVRITPSRVLGKGRAAKAVLVDVEEPGGKKYQCVEKLFKPGWLTRFIYWCFFQSPFPYSLSFDAISACLHRRKTAEKFLEARGVDIGMAPAYYIRWDEKERAFALGTEFIKGVGLQVSPADSRIFRRFVHNYAVRPVKRLSGRKCPKETGERSEASRLVSRMKQAERLFRESGLIGTGWQVSPGALVATANFIKNDSRYVLIDIESGIPSLLVPYYLFKSLAAGRFPYFDDIDEKRLKKYIDQNSTELANKLGPNGAGECAASAELLVEYTKKWKAGEIALFRHHFSLFFPSVRARIKKARADEWLREGILDKEGSARFAETKRFFSSMQFLSGIFPGRPGRVLRKLAGNYGFRREFRKFFKDSEFRQCSIKSYIAEHARSWKEAQRIPRDKRFASLWGKFTLHLLLGKLAPGGLHRFISDGRQRKKIGASALLFIISEKFQTEYAKYVIFRRMREWVDDRRLPVEEARLMRTRVEDGSMQEYVRVFGIHFALKFLEPVTSAIKIVGIGWFLRIFVSIYPELNPHGELTIGLFKAFIGTFLHNPIPVLMMINTSVWRTLITLWRMLSIKRRHISYKVALMIGVIPAFGSLAYPLQMYWSCRELSIFLIRDILAVFSQNVPVYGGKHTLVEAGFVWMANMPAEIMEMMKGAFDRVKTRMRMPAPAAQNTGSDAEALEAKTASEPPGNDTAKKTGNRLDKLVDEMVDKIWEKYSREFAGTDF